MKAEELIAFEKDIAHEWESGHIKAPVHLVGGNEEHLISIFKDVKPEDYVYSSHRSHYHALLKGVPLELVKSEIMKGNSICLNFPDYHFYSSGIVAGSLPHAVGTALAGHKTWAFCGDMAAQSGIFSECTRFADKMNLPITFVVENNGYSVKTPTSAVWTPLKINSCRVITYFYNNKYPHQGTGVHVEF
jgi:pyruvate dehydrogenase E1 component alpha subunit